MNPNWLRLVRSALLATLALAACSPGGWRYRTFVPEAEQYVRAAANGDFHRVEQLSANPEPVQWMRLSFQDEPELLRAASIGLEPIAGTVRNDTVFVHFKFPYRAKREVLLFRFVRQDGKYLITNVGLPERI